MSQYQLYYFPQCPYCQYVLSEINGLSIEIEPKNIMENNVFRNELMAGGGKTQVPCLRVENDGATEWMYESRDIVQYLKNLTMTEATS